MKSNAFSNMLKKMTAAQVCAFGWELNPRPFDAPADALTTVYPSRVLIWSNQLELRGHRGATHCRPALQGRKQENYTEII